MFSTQHICVISMCECLQLAPVGCEVSRTGEQSADFFVWHGWATEKTTAAWLLKSVRHELRHEMRHEIQVVGNEIYSSVNIRKDAENWKCRSISSGNQGNKHGGYQWPAPGDWLDFGAKKGSTPDLSLSYGLSVMSVFECGWYQIQAPCNTGTPDETDCFWI